MGLQPILSKLPNNDSACQHHRIIILTGHLLVLGAFVRVHDFQIVQEFIPKQSDLKLFEMGLAQAIKLFGTQPALPLVNTLIYSWGYSQIHGR